MELLRFSSSGIQRPYEPQELPSFFSGQCHHNIN
uniref:Uncharacterized protein n=1 Tax=Physcomitrium patens TaxID=3218 RepID=A0A2K1K6E1_PHYPA|nr:hypothetical protein PHYPA_011238 [Physcomitrium patens]